MKKVMLLACLLLALSGCAILRNPLFWRITVGSVIRAAYEAGGAEMVGERIDRLEEKGQISAEAAPSAILNYKMFLGIVQGK